jgi:hypothetical protein
MSNKHKNEIELPEDVRIEIQNLRRHAIAIIVSTERLLQTTDDRGTINRRPSFTIGPPEHK